MGFIKYITVYDDESKMVFNCDILKKYKISAYPTVFFSNGKPYYSSVNVKSAEYETIKINSKDFSEPEIPSEVFMYAYQTAYDAGFLKVVVICPHSKWYPYYKSAMKAARSFRRHKNIDLTTFEITVIDSKSFAIGPMLQTLELAHKHDLFGYSSSLAIDSARKAPKNSHTFVLTKSAASLGICNDELTAYSIYANKLKNIDISQSHEHIQFDMFAKSVADCLLKNEARYAVSIGCNCDFAANIIGRIQKYTGKEPFCCMQYGIASVAVLGDKTLSVHIV